MDHASPHSHMFHNRNGASMNNERLIRDIVTVLKADAKPKVRLSAIDMLIEDRCNTGEWLTQLGDEVDCAASDLLCEEGFTVENW